MSKKKVHNLEANSLELHMKQIVKITEDDGIGIVMDCEVHEVPNKRKKKKPSVAQRTEPHATNV